MTSTKHVKTPTRKTDSPNPLSTDSTNDNPAGQQDLSGPSHIYSLTTPPLKPPGRIQKPVRRREKQRKRIWWQTVSGRRRRNDYEIKPQQIEGMWWASNIATDLGYPLNTCLTLRWSTPDLVAMQLLFNRLKVLRYMGKGAPQPWRAGVHPVQADRLVTSPRMKVAKG